jgi:hypothetical protein
MAASTSNSLPLKRTFSAMPFDYSDEVELSAEGESSSISMAKSGHMRPQVAQYVQRAGSVSPAKGFPSSFSSSDIAIIRWGQTSTHKPHPLQRSAKKRI